MAEDTTTIPTVNIDVAQEKLKPRLVALLFCDFTNTTKEGKTNLLGAFERIYVDPDKKKTPFFFVFVRTAQTLMAELRVSVVAPSGAVTAGLGYQGLPSGERVSPDLHPHINGIFRMQFATPVEGAYWFDISYGEESLGGAALLVEFRKPVGTDSVEFKETGE